MSTHDDRTASRPAHLCAAYGCPMVGTTTSSTQGTNEWWCWLHFAKDAGRFQRITAELHRLDWLAKAATDIRLLLKRPEWPAAFARIEHDLMLANRPDLRWTDGESERQWMERLERELSSIIGEDSQAPRQQPLIATSQAKPDHGTFSRVSISPPQGATA
ncbi:hypothetical protein RCH08_005239 [Janthinobacterium sp. CG_S6]|nr:hypothetical protein [Janthinobacterium sp. CG_S6]